VVIHPGAGRDQAAHDHVLLEAAQVIHPTGDRRLGQHASRLRKDAAEMNDSVESEAFVMPSSSGSATEGCPSAVSARSFSSWKRKRSTCSSSRNSVSPTSLIRTQRSIWRTITSMCLSLICTPCNLYTS